jgi:IS30 family transposase
MHHLTVAERETIEFLALDQYKPKEIALEIGCSVSTIYRELKRGRDPKGAYRSTLGVDLYTNNRAKILRLDMASNQGLRDSIVELLKTGWDPSQIAGRLRRENHALRVCSETIYCWIYKSLWATQNQISKFLRYGRKKRRAHHERKAHCLSIPNRVSIDQRPLVVGQKTRFGDWETDSVIYRDKKVINTLNERLSSFVIFKKLENKTSLNTALAIISSLKGRLVHSITSDNGTEFSDHELITRALKTPVYFADPYSSWQRGANENINRQLRGFLPKKSNINNLTQEQLDQIAWEINNKPRKRLNWLTPKEVYDWLTQNPTKTPNLTKIAFQTRI